MLLLEGGRGHKIRTGRGSRTQRPSERPQPALFAVDATLKQLFHSIRGGFVCLIWHFEESRNRISSIQRTKPRFTAGFKDIPSKLVTVNKSRA